MEECINKYAIKGEVGEREGEGGEREGEGEKEDILHMLLSKDGNHTRCR